MASEPSKFFPNQVISITNGMFVGMTGRVIGMGEVIQRNLPLNDAIQCGDAFWVIMTIFGREVPIELGPHQMVPR